MIALQVRWPNAGHALLASPDIKVSVGGTPLEPVDVKAGAWTFQVPDGAADLSLAALFSAELPVAPEGDGATTRSFTLFSAFQDYAVEGDVLTPTSAVLINVDGGAGEKVRHPLVQSVSAANALSGAAVIELRTEFLDLTEQWMANTPPAWERFLYGADSEPESAFVALAATGSGPPLWFAHFPKDLNPPIPELGAMVFFRPHAHYTYATAFERTHCDRGMRDLCRYLLAPKGNVPVVYNGQPYRIADRDAFFDPSYALRVGWQQALIRSGKPIVVFHPWPTSGLAFGDALTAKLPQRLEEMMRLLLGTARVGASHEALTLGRLGLAGYSAGGSPAAEAMKANRARVQELYLFDPYQFGAQIPYVVAWARSTPDFRLRMTGANFWGQMQTIQQTTIAGFSPEEAQFHVSLRPDSPTFYNAADKGGGDYWAYVTHKHPEYVGDFNVTHQFAIFGGDQIVVDVDGDTMLANVTWLEEFLSMSGF